MVESDTYKFEEFCYEDDGFEDHVLGLLSVGWKIINIETLGTVKHIYAYFKKV